jgi:hypothetical protein
MPAYSLASRQRRRAVRAAEEADGSAVGLAPIHAQLLTMQRQAGNKAVTAFLAGQAPPQMQRDISGGDLRGARSNKEGLRAAFVSDTYSKIITALDDFRSKPSVIQAKIVVGLCDDWLKKHGAEGTKRSRAKKALIEDVRAEVERGAGKLRAQAAYVNQYEGGEGEWHPLAAPNLNTKNAALGPSAELASGDVTKKAGNIQNKDELARLKGGANLITKYKLTAAEVAAIRTYTSGDYRYINPAAAGDKDWMKNQMARNQAKGGSYFNQNATEKQLTQEGGLQTGMMASGLARLPKWEGELWRGERQTFDKVLELYASGTFEQKSIGSASKDRTVAHSYANGTGGGDPDPDQNVYVLLRLHVTEGRDISKIGAVSGEGEVTLLPGTKFSIDHVTRLERGPAGNARVPAKAWYVVTLSQLSK